MSTKIAWFVTARVMEVMGILKIQHEKSFAGILQETISNVVGSTFETMTTADALKIMINIAEMLPKEALSNNLYEGVYFALMESHVNMWDALRNQNMANEAIKERSVERSESASCPNTVSASCPNAVR